MEMGERYMDEIENDGSSMAVTKEELADLQSQAQEIATGLQAMASSDPYDVRNCYWPGQSVDGRKRAVKGSNEAPRPFEGATDARVRDSDMIINEKVQLAVMSSLLSVLRADPVGAEDVEQAANLQIMIDYYISNMGIKFVREVMRLANFVYGSNPAAGVMGVEWRREMALELRELSLMELQQMAVKEQLDSIDLSAMDAQMQMELVQQSAMAFTEALVNKEFGEEVLTGMIMRFFPSLKEYRARLVIREIRKQLLSGTPPTQIKVEFPVSYVRLDVPELTALEIGRDIFLPTDTTDFEDGWGYFVSELLTRSEVKTRAKEEGWNEAAVEEVLGTGEGDSFGIRGSLTFAKWAVKNGVTQKLDTTSAKNKYEIITAIYRSTTEEGIPGIFQVRFAINVSEALTKRELRRDKHGNYPGVLFAREYLDRMIFNSRSIADLEQSSQGLAKLFLDTCGDNAQFNGVPPIKSTRRLGSGKMYVEPMEEIKLMPGGDVQWMNVPPFPAAAMNMFKVLEQKRDDYWGRMNGGLPPQRNQVRERFEAMLWLSHLRDVYVMVAQLIQQYAPEETVLRVLNNKGRLAQSREDIQGQFDFRLEFDTDVLNPETLETKLNMIKNVLLSMDNEQTVDKSEIVRYYMFMLNPGLARTSVRTVNDAQKEETEAEAKVYESIRAGLPFEMPTDGSINAPLRMMFYQNLQSENPAVFADMAQDKMQKLEERMQYLQHQAQQYGDNAQTGRTGVAATMGGMKSGAVRA